MFRTMIALALFGFASNAFAQDAPEQPGAELTEADDAAEASDTTEPADDELSGAVNLTIEVPAAGESVALPFSIVGRAAPAATLELWQGDTLERVFRADSNGHFVVPVTRGDAPIVVYETSAGERIQSVVVDAVITSTPAPALAAQPAQPLPPVAQTLPPVEPTPPPPTITVAPLADTTAHAPYPRRPVPRGVRVIAEAGAGAGAAMSGIAVGFLVGVIASGPFTDGFGILGSGAIGAVVGGAVALPIGVTLAGHALGGHGKVGYVVLGEFAGLTAATLLAVITMNGPVMAVSFATLPLAGAIVGYELSSNAAERRHSWSPSVTLTRDDTPVVGFRLTF